MILKRHECSGEIFSASSAQEFKDNIDNLCLEDLPLKEGQWTWSNQRVPPSFYRIDKFLVSTDLLVIQMGPYFLLS